MSKSAKEIIFDALCFLDVCTARLHMIKREIRTLPASVSTDKYIANIRDSIFVVIGRLEYTKEHCDTFLKENKKHDSANKTKNP